MDFHRGWPCSLSSQREQGSEIGIAIAFGLIYSKIIFGIQYWSQCNESLKNQIQLLMNKAARIVMNKKTREMHVLDLYRCLKWHTLDTLMTYHDYLLFFSIITHGQPGNLKILYDENKSHTINNEHEHKIRSETAVKGRVPGEMTEPPRPVRTEEDPLKGLLTQGPITRSMRYGRIKRNNKTDGAVGSLRFGSFVPRSVRLFNQLPEELHPSGEGGKAWKIRLRTYCMEKKLGPEDNWPNYDDLNGRILPSDRELERQGKKIVKKENGLFIEPIGDNSDSEDGRQNNAAN